MNAPWTTRQREWLRALGHSVLVLAGDDAGPVGSDAGPAEVDVEVDEPPAPSPPRASRPQPPMRRPAPPMEPVVVDLPAASGGGQAAGMPGRIGDRLYRAVLRATGRRTPREGEALLQTVAFDLDALRADPARKRALWLQLRAARKAGRQ